MNDRHVISDETWAVIEPLLPATAGKEGGRSRKHRPFIEEIAYTFLARGPWGASPGASRHGGRCGSGMPSGRMTAPGSASAGGLSKRLAAPAGGRPCAFDTEASRAGARARRRGVAQGSR